MSERSTGGNRFIGADAGIGELLAAIQTGLRDLRTYAEDTDRRMDLSAISVETKLTRDGRLISVQVASDLTAAEPRPQAAGAEDEGGAG
jgi:hypothetical protein